jgi:nitric oxide reductase large subunit
MEVSYMPVFVILIIFSITFYVYYKLKYFRSNRPMERRWISAKSSIALGAFVFFFAINQFFIHQSTISLIVGIVFVLVGGGSAWAGMRAYKHYLPLVVEEAKQLGKNGG